MVLIYILIATVLISAVSLIGALTLFFKKDLVDKILLVLVAFSAGALLGGAFLHLIPESIEEAGRGESPLLKIFLYLLLGFCLFFILEQFINWHHHHSTEHSEIKIKPFSHLILISDAIHNFIDGLVIAASFVVSLPLGLTTGLAVMLHEIPQEIGDFAVLLYGGFSRKKALFLNFLSAALAILGGVLGFLLSEKIAGSIIFLLPFAAGNFIYIACSDLIPEIKRKENFPKEITYFFVFLLGIVLMLAMRLFLE